MKLTLELIGKPGCFEPTVSDIGENIEAQKRIIIQNCTASDLKSLDATLSILNQIKRKLIEKNQAKKCSIRKNKPTAPNGRILREGEQPTKDHYET